MNAYSSVATDYDATSADPVTDGWRDVLPTSLFTVSSSTIARARLRARIINRLGAQHLGDATYAIRSGHGWIVLNISAIDSICELSTGTFHLDDLGEIERAIRDGRKPDGWMPVVEMREAVGQ